jgi:16S rRNA (adenine1518-N6/adenine1519-N6)-dimethyltransferase
VPNQSELKSLLSKYGLWANHRLGQNFLLSDKVYGQILDAADLKSSDEVIEVGPGTGYLTEKLIEKAKRVIAVEYDAGMVRLLTERFSYAKNLALVHSDILKFWIEKSGVKSHKYKLVANIPYYITSPLIRLFLQSACPPSLMVVLVQKEVAERICGKAEKSVLFFETQLFGTPSIEADVPPDSFFPAPKVDSAILKIVPYAKPLASDEVLQEALKLIKFGYNQRRKKLTNALEAGLRIEADTIRSILTKAKIDLGCRAEELEIEDWLRLARELTHSTLR